jgi:hypothetical protein
MGAECSACSCNDLKDTDESTALNLDKKSKSMHNEITEKE